MVVCHSLTAVGFVDDKAMSKSSPPLARPFGLSLSKPGPDQTQTVRAELVEVWAPGCFGGVPGLRAEAGLSPRRASNFLLLRQKKVTKEKAPPSLRPPRGAWGQPASGRLRGAPWNSLRAVGASLGQPRRVRSRCMRAPTRMFTPQPPRRRRSQQGVGAEQPNSHTGLCFARPKLACAARRDGLFGYPIPGFSFLWRRQRK